MLPPRLKEMALDRARAEGVSFGELLRRALEAAVSAPRRKRRATDDPLLADTAVYRGPAPADISTRHDAYLYGGR